MREFRTYGSVRGAHGNGRPYRDQTLLVSEGRRRAGRGSHPELGPRPAPRRDGDHEMTHEQKIIRAKVGLLELANVSQACKMTAYLCCTRGLLVQMFLRSITPLQATPIDNRASANRVSRTVPS
jgi:hypothetical protein